MPMTAIGVTGRSALFITFRCRLTVRRRRTQPARRLVKIVIYIYSGDIKGRRVSIRRLNDRHMTGLPATHRSAHRARHRNPPHGKRNQRDRVKRAGRVSVQFGRSPLHRRRDNVMCVKDFTVERPICWITLLIILVRQLTADGSLIRLQDLRRRG